MGLTPFTMEERIENIGKSQVMSIAEGCDRTDHDRTTDQILSSIKTEIKSDTCNKSDACNIENK